MLECLGLTFKVNRQSKRGARECVRGILGAPEGKAWAQQVPGPIERAEQSARRSP